MRVRFPLFFVLLFSLLGCGKNGQDDVDHPGEITSSTVREPRVPDPPFESELRSEFDGEGKATVEPDTPVLAGSKGTWKIRFETGEHGIEKGGGVNLVISSYWGWTPAQSDLPQYRGYTSLTTSSTSGTLELETMEHLVFVRVKEGRLVAGDEVIITYGDTSGGEFPMAAATCDKFAESVEEFHIRVDADGDGFYASLPFGSQPGIEILGREAVRLRLLGPSFAVLGEDVRYTVAALDVLDNRSSLFEGDVEISRLGEEGGQRETVNSIHFSKEDRGAASLNVRFEEPGVFQLNASGPNLEATSNPVVVLSKIEGYHIYWGDLQGHSGLCDGSGTPEDYYSYARDVSRLDFCALTTHDAWGLYMLDEHPEVWELSQRVTGDFHEDNAFVTFVAYEYTNWTSGHKHVLFPGKKGEVVSYRMPSGKDPDRLWESLGETGALTISHHPGGGPIGQDWSYSNPSMETVVEMCSVHGSSEYYGCPRMIHRPEKGGFAQDALARGLRLGFVGSGDTHNGHPGMGDRQSATGGLVAVFANELTRESVLSALREKRVYATAGRRIILTFSVKARKDGSSADSSSSSWMGGTVTLASPDQPRHLEALAIGEVDIRFVEVVKNGETVFREEGSGRQVSLQIVDEEVASSGDYYYIRVTQEDGEQAWSSPIWMEFSPNE